MSALDKFHDEAMESAFFGDLERRKGNEERALRLFEEALELERKAIAEMTRPIEPTWSILHRSAGWLALDCNEPKLAKQFARKALRGDPPLQIAEELRNLQKQANNSIGRSVFCNVKAFLEPKGLARLGSACAVACSVLLVIWFILPDNEPISSVELAYFVTDSVTSASGELRGNNPLEEKWWPSEFGADDQAGAVQYITADKVVQAARLVKRGMTATLGMPYYNGMPLVPGRTFALSIPGGGTPTQGPLSWEGDSYQMTFMDELLTAEIGQVGTQWDGLGHPMIKVSGVDGWEDGNYFYNGFRLEDVGSPRGLQAVGNEHVAEIGFFTRGILIDIAALKHVDRLDKGYAITMADFNAALEAQGIDDANQGDVVLFRTGWNSLWKDYSSIVPARIAEFGSGEPGVSPEVCDHLAKKKISMIGSDTWGLEPYDFSKGMPESYFAYCHMNLTARRGITNFENLDLEKLSREKAYEFAFAWSPLKLVGATGSPGNPVVAW